MGPFDIDSFPDWAERPVQQGSNHSIQDARLPHECSLHMPLEIVSDGLCHGLTTAVLKTGIHVGTMHHIRNALTDPFPY